MNEGIVDNKILLKVIANIISPFNPRVNNSYENKILTYKEDCGSKKNDEKRHEELISLCLNDIFRVVNLNVKFLLTDPTYSTILPEIITLLNKNGEEDNLKIILKNISTLVDIDYKKNFDTIETTLLAEKSSHFVLNRILKIIGGDLEKNDFKLNFFKEIACVILNNLDGFLKTKGIFIIVTIVENAASKKYLIKELGKFKSMIKTKGNEKDQVGFKILNKVLTEEK
jgi:hypothetical protein